MAWAGLDIGAKRTGVAVSESQILATPLTDVAGSVDEQVAKLLPLFADHQVSTVVVGVTRSTQERVREFIHKLETALAEDERSIDVFFVDEALTTKEAERFAQVGGQRTQFSSDTLAAALLLEQYFAEHGGGDDAR